MNETIVIELTTQEARALIGASELMIDAFGPEVRKELGVGPGETTLEIAGLKLASAVERQEAFA